MITQPPASRIIEVLQRELIEHVLATVDDPQGQASVQMIAQILGTLQVRVEHEIAWMHEETGAIADLAGRVLQARPGAEEVTRAMGALDADPSTSLHLAEVTARYALASEVLSAVLEAVPTDSPLRPDVEAQLDLRLQHEVEVIGDFSLIGRS